jgi:hypothetical protein
MATAPNSLSQVTPLLTNLVDDCVQLSQSNKAGSSADANGPYGKLLADLEKLVRAILHSSSWQPGTEMPPNGATSQPTPFSTDAMPSDVQNDPMSQLPQEDLDRGQDFSSNAPMMMARSVEPGDDSGNIAASDPSDINSANFSPEVTDGLTTRDHRTVSQDPTVTETIDPNTGAIVRDHRHPQPTDPPGHITVGWNPPPAEPPTSGSSSGLGGTSFTSAADYAALGQDNNDLEAAKAAALADPTDPAKQLAFQEAAQKLQLTFNLLQQMSSMKASMADAAIKNIKVNAA